jgi:hypothetical protein
MTEQMAFTAEFDPLAESFYEMWNTPAESRVPAPKVLMPIEFVSSSSKRRYRMDKPEAVR